MSDLTSLPLDPSITLRLRARLEHVGWQVVGRRPGSYERLRDPDTGISLVIPLNPSAPDYADLMAGALNVLRTRYAEVWVRALAPLFIAPSADTFEFCRETATPRGFIHWNDGKDLIHAAQGTLLAGAKYWREPATHYGNRFAQFASRYLNTILMGQTGTGSYVVTAFAPADITVQIQSTGQERLGLEGIDIVQAGAITEAVVRSLDATARAISQYRETASLSAFSDKVSEGVCYEMAMAMRDVVARSDGAEIRVEFHAAEGDGRKTRRFELLPTDAGILDVAAVELADSARPEPVRVTGRVHLLTKKEAAGPGVVGIDDGRRKYRLRLGSDEEYHRAVVAHDENGLVRVEGELSREGNISWLYGARLLDVLDEPPEGGSPVPGDGSNLFEP